MKELSLKKLIITKAHWGKHPKRLEKLISPYIKKEDNKRIWINPIVIKEALKGIWSFLKEASTEKKSFLFIGTRKQYKNIIKTSVRGCLRTFYINKRWLGGSLTNWVTIQKKIKYLKALEDNKESHFFKSLPKKEKVQILEEIEKLRKTFEGVRNMVKFPDFIILVDPKYDRTAFLECKKLQVPIIGIVGTDCNPNPLDMVIPTNTNSKTVIKLILDIMTDGILAGQNSK